MDVLVGGLQLGELLSVVSHCCLWLLSVGVRWVTCSPVCVNVEEEEGGYLCCHHG